MSFDIQKFRDAKVIPRTREVLVEQLKHFFDADEKPVIKIRNLTGEELAACNEAVKSNSQIKAMLEKLMSENAKDKAEAICQSLGISSKVSDDLVRRINMLRFGSVEPDITNEDAVRFAAILPEPFYDLTNQIIQLTSLGADLGELNAFGQTQA